MAETVQQPLRERSNDDGVAVKYELPGDRRGGRRSGKRGIGPSVWAFRRLAVDLA